MTLGASLEPAGVEDAGRDGPSFEAEDDSSREGAAASSVEGDAESGEAVLLDGPSRDPYGVARPGGCGARSRQTLAHAPKHGVLPVRPEQRLDLVVHLL